MLEVKTLSFQMDPEGASKKILLIGEIRKFLSGSGNIRLKIRTKGLFEISWSGLIGLKFWLRSIRTHVKWQGF